MSSEKVKIPTLALDGQSWKIFRVKLIEATAMQQVLGLLAGWEVEPDDEDSQESSANQPFRLTELTALDGA